MSTPASSPTIAAAAHPLPEPPFPPALVEEVCRNLTRAVKTRQLYLQNNPMYQRSLDSVRSAFAALWKETDGLCLGVGETEFRWEGRVVAHDASRAESVAWLLYKDGIREITFHPQFEGVELVALLDLLQRVRKASSEENDLLTLLWEQDFLYVRYRFIDLGHEPAREIEAPPVLVEERRIDVEELKQEDEARPQIVRMEDFDAALYFLDEGEIEYLRNEIQVEYSSDLRKNVLSILLDILEVENGPTVRDEICDILEALILQLISEREFGTVAFILREARIAAERAPDLAAVHRERLQRLPDKLSVPEVLQHLLAMLDESPDVPPQADLDAMFEQLRPNTLALVFSWLAKLHNPSLRTALQQAATRLAAANTSELLKLILSPDQVVAQQAIKRAGELRAPAAVTPLARVLALPVPELRLAGVLALAEIGSPSAMKLVEQAMNDGDRDVRVAALRAIGARSYAPALAKVASLINGRAVRQSNLTEKMALFEVYGMLAGAEAIGQLDSLLNAKAFFARREDAEIRACAAMALGRIGTGDAMASLRRASGDKDVLVRNAVSGALRGGAA